MLIYLMRHGETEGQGPDPHLSIRGRGQAKIAAGIICMEARPGAVFSSPMRRAVETAEILADAAGAQLKVSDLLEPESDGEAFISSLSGADGRTHIAAVTHLPVLRRIVSGLTGIHASSLTVGPGGVACVEVTQEADGASLVWLSGDTAFSAMLARRGGGVGQGK